ncbi:hypothetical protein EI555_009233 [Monodon monoceros]|uniref:Thymosin beta-10 n=1 Tax=Monodon monoceros TaxID=40151 RepID=A0A4U1FAT2_MONMO|nr:hypothetical protein EI555_009233 [Monodon monoceros]
MESGLVSTKEESDTSQSTGTTGLERNFSDCFKKMAEKPDMGEIASFYKAELKKTETEENTLPTKETVEQESKRSEIS